MVVTLVRTRLREGIGEEYGKWAARMTELAQTMPGYIGHKGFVAEDGERVTIVEFESEETQRAWSFHPEHVEAKKKGRAEFYTEYQLVVCSVVRSRKFP